MKRRKSYAGAMSGFGATDTTDQILQYTIQAGDTIATISDNTGDVTSDLISLNTWLGNFAAGDSLAPVSNGGAYDGNDYTGNVVNYYNPNYVAPGTAIATVTAPAAPAQVAAPSASAGIFSSLSSLVSSAGQVAVGTAAKAAGVTTSGQSIAAAAAQQSWMLYAGIAAAVVAIAGGLMFMAEEGNLKKIPSKANPRRRRRKRRLV